ncbi:hypothetical protein [Aneurinibacillus migulanus]|uniref:hypothetical protein n=1 Tax=Aneurinibacillus migulanus TaxID=47500 RepID=UPI000A700CA0|nr:hypothetical protein [Aneurinibacillus migulanus]
MKSVTINGMAGISEGKLKGTCGRVIGFDSEIDEVWIQVDESTKVITVSDNIKQNQKK